MAHNLEIKNGTASFFTVKEPAWHNLGTVVTEAQTQEEALKLARLDYEVCLVKPYVFHPEGDAIILNQHRGGALLGRAAEVKGDFHAVTRCDTGAVFGFVSGKYNVIQNREAFLFFDNFIERTESIYHTAGVLQDGRISWILAKLPEHIEVHGEVIDMYVLIINYHDGKHAMQAMITPIKVVCNNTLDAAVKGCKNIIPIRHTSTYKEQIDEAVRLMGIKNTYEAQITELFTSLAEVKVNNDVAKKYFQNLIVGKTDYEVKEVSPQKLRMLDDMIRYYIHHPSQQQCVGNAFGLYNAATGYFQNMKDYKNDEQKFNNILLGASDSKITARALDLAMAL